MVHVGNSFGSVREGIRAQIQHLKAYASSDGLNNACVDPRFSYVKRASAIYVEWLGIKENPYGGGWARIRRIRYKHSKFIHQKIIFILMITKNVCLRFFRADIFFVNYKARLTHIFYYIKNFFCTFFPTEFCCLFKSFFYHLRLYFV